MEDIYFKVFKKQEDYTNWQKFIEYVNLHPDFSEDEKIRIQDAIDYMASKLGSSFLATSKSYKHFLSQHFMNLAPWSLRWSIWFAEALKDLIENDSSKKLFSGLISKDRSEEVLTFLEINHYLKKPVS